MHELSVDVDEDGATTTAPPTSGVRGSPEDRRRKGGWGSDRSRSGGEAPPGSELAAKFCDPSVSVELRVDHPSYAGKVTIDGGARASLATDLS